MPGEAQARRPRPSQATCTSCFGGQTLHGSFDALEGQAGLLFPTPDPGGPRGTELCFPTKHLRKQQGCASGSQEDGNSLIYFLADL